MIRFILLQNRAGKTRLAKYYVPVSDGEKRRLEYDVHRLIVVRDPKHTNFVEVRSRGLRSAAQRCRTDCPSLLRVRSSTSWGCIQPRPSGEHAAGWRLAAAAAHASARAAGAPPGCNPRLPACPLPTVQDVQGRVPPLRRPLLLHRCAATRAHPRRPLRTPPAPTAHAPAPSRRAAASPASSPSHHIAPPAPRRTDQALTPATASSRRSSSSTCLWRSSTTSSQTCASWTWCSISTRRAKEGRAAGGAARSPGPERAARPHRVWPPPPRQLPPAHLTPLTVLSPLPI